MADRGNGRVAHEEEQWIGILAAVRIVAAVTVVIVGVVVVTVPRGT